MIGKIALGVQEERETIRKWVKVLGAFLLGQGAIQFVQLLSGFLLIRWLTVEEYAQYSITFAFQSTAQMLVELGFSGAIVALVGPKIHNKEVIGEYIKAGKYYRNRLFIIVGLICLIVFPLLNFHHGWPLYITCILLCSILFNLFFSGLSAYYTTPLRMHKRLKDLYSVELKSSLGRLSVLGLLALFSGLNAWIAAILSSLTLWYNGRAFKEKAGVLIAEPETSSQAARKEIYSYIKPVIPGIIYSAFSAQIALFIIGVFGKSESIAEVGALGRLGQLFLILNAASSILVAPFLARQSDKVLVKRYLNIMAGATVLATGIAAFAYVFPEPLLWIIGSKYAHLEKEVGLLILNSCIMMLNVLMWDMNCSRKWIWTWIPIVSISSNIVLQVVLVFCMDLSTTYNVLVFSIILSSFNLLNKILVAFIGLNKVKHEANLL
ncbi:lipopolysaccharide biosynthesis protein [Pontibacter sp. SGAir0037]|uniref:lipopolysaccharide biosynthesis protein n=1 Tax=Pontibacter sp. SGAir0037 TaxID=2571030 RepID=UPI0010CCDE2C|nr:oligosaccharide flippase family protein [Pontibacter sp. SGAir0037]QCR22607.1 hypothetical protein C1N53_09830 [Pontibacter sp. SGAir0037]